MVRLERVHHLTEPLIPIQDNLALVLLCVTTVILVQRHWRKVDRRHAQEQEVTGARCIYVFEEATVYREDGVVERGVVEPPAVSYVVDADEEGEERRRG